MPSAIVITAVSVNSGLRQRTRAATFQLCRATEPPKRWSDIIHHSATDNVACASNRGRMPGVKLPRLLLWSVTETATAPAKSPTRTSFFRFLAPRFVIGILLLLVFLWSHAVLLLVSYRWIDPPTTAVHIERRMQAWIRHSPYRERYKFVALNQISPDLQHAVIAAEDTHFYQHHGFDWHEIQIAAREDLEGERTRGASTITQQLVKNL